MTRLQPGDLASFARSYRFIGGRVRRVKVRAIDGRTDIVVDLTVRTVLKDLGTDPKAVRLRLKLVDVDEYRFQKRPAGSAGKMADARFAYLQDLMFVTFDALPMEPNERPAVHDFRATDAFAAARDVYWEVVRTPS